MANSHHLVVRRARRSDVPELAMVLTRAFAGDPFFSWLLSDRDTHRTFQSGFYRSMLYHHVLHGSATDVVTLRTDGREARVIGGALWAAPHAATDRATNSQGVPDALGNGPASPPLTTRAVDRLEQTVASIRLAADGLRIAKGRPRLVLAGLRQLSRLRPDEPHWYLDTIGTDPVAGHIGAGRALLKHRLAIADRDHLPAYLEASTQGVVAFYERFGFRPRQRITLPNGPTLWTMLRPPQEQTPDSERAERSRVSEPPTND